MSTPGCCSSTSRVLRSSAASCCSTPAPDPLQRAGVSQRISCPGASGPRGCALGFVQIRRGHEDGDPVLHQLVQNRPEIAARNRIHAVGRLVQKQNPRAGAAACTSAPASVSCRPKACPPAASRNGSMRVMRSSRAVSSVALLPRDAEQVGVEDHVLVHRQIADTGRSAAPCSRSGPSPPRDFARHVVPRHARAAFGRIHQAAQHAQRGGLARAIRPHQPEDLALARPPDSDGPPPSASPNRRGQIAAFR